MKYKYTFLVLLLVLVSIMTAFSQEEVLKLVDQQPYFGNSCIDMSDKVALKKCRDKELLSYINSNVSYPQAAIDAATEGIVPIRFVVEKDGSITGAEILKDIGNGCGDEALRVINEMPKWNPGKNKGELVRTQFVVPVKFKIKWIPVTVIEHRFQNLEHIFCQDYLAEFGKVKFFRAMAEEDLSADNLCGIEGVVNALKALKVTIVSDGKPKSVESSGEFTSTMKQWFRELEAGDVVELDYRIWVKQKEGEEKELYRDISKSIILEE